MRTPVPAGDCGHPVHNPIRALGRAIVAWVEDGMTGTPAGYGMDPEQKAQTPWWEWESDDEAWRADLTRHGWSLADLDPDLDQALAFVGEHCTSLWD